MILSQNHHKSVIENNSITKPSLIHDRLKIMSQVYHNFKIYPESVISCLSSISSFLVVTQPKPSVCTQTDPKDLYLICICITVIIISHAYMPPKGRNTQTHGSKMCVQTGPKGLIIFVPL